jgi:hypothetical protein
MDTRVSELRIEPVSSEESEYHQEDSLHASREPLGLAYSLDIEIVIYEPYTCNTEECEYDYICLVTIP